MSRQVDIIIKADAIITVDDGNNIINNGAIAVNDKVILDVGSASDITSRYTAREVLECSVAMPGFVNTHNHAAMVYMRGIADDLPLMQWLEGHIWPQENRWLSAEFVRDAAELSCIEMIRSGTTAFCDMYFFGTSTAEAASSMGMRAMIGAGVIDFPTKTTTGPEDCLNKAAELIERYSGHEFITPGIAAHSPYTCGPETLKAIASLSEKTSSPVMIHLSETRWESQELMNRYGARPAFHLENCGLLRPGLIAAHCVWLDDDEIDLIAKKQVVISHCLESNLKLGSGIAPLPRMLEHGARVTLGTDGAASNNDQSLLGEMQSVALVHKGVATDPTAIGIDAAIRMATRNGAEALGINAGVIEKGRLADIVLFDFNKPHLQPVHNPASQVVYSAMSSDVKHVIINGRIVMRDGHVVCASEADAIEKAREWGRMIRQAGLD